MIHIWFCEKTLRYLLDRLDKAPPDQAVFIEEHGIHFQVRRHNKLDKDHQEFFGYEDEKKQ